MGKRDEWATPWWLFNKLDGMYGFDLDVCATAANTKIADAYLTPEMDGLKSSWGRMNWCNPPYSDAGPWFHKAIREAIDGRCTLMLTHECMTAQWFNTVSPRVDRIFLPTRRISFLDENGVERTQNDRASMLSLITPWSVRGERGPTVERIEL